MKKIVFSLFALMMICFSLGGQPWREASLKDIRPAGWLEQKLLTQKEGLSGHPEALSYPYNTCLWAGEIHRMGTHGQGRGIRHSHETCNAIDMSWTLGYFLEILQDARYADMIEKIVFNAGAGSVTEDFKGPAQYIDLVPYGTTTLRLTVFPVICE